LRTCFTGICAKALVRKRAATKSLGWIIRLSTVYNILFVPHSSFDFHPDHHPRGEKHRLHVTVDETVALPVLLARGSAPGRTLVVSANVHGDEYEGVRAIFEVFEELDPAQMSGDLLAVPVVNPPAFWSGTRASPVDGENLARVFPGSADGTISHRIAHVFSNAIIAHASLYVDLHSGGVRYRMPSMVGYASTDERGRAAALVFGAPVIWGHPRLDPGRTISSAASRDIPWLYTEARGAGRIHPEDLGMMKNGIRNLLRHLGILPGAPTPGRIGHRLFGDGNTDHGMSATQPGFLMTQVRILDDVKAGHCLGTLVDLQGQPLEKYYAPVDGVVGLIREFPVVAAGDPLFLIAQREGEGTNG
jgi:predicted deacylase